MAYSGPERRTRDCVRQVHAEYDGDYIAVPSSMIRDPSGSGDLTDVLREGRMPGTTLN